MSGSQLQFERLAKETRNRVQAENEFYNPSEIPSWFERYRERLKRAREDPRLGFQQRAHRLLETSRTIEIRPIPPTIAEPDIYDFLMQVLVFPPVELVKLSEMDPENDNGKAIAVLRDERSCKTCIGSLNGRKLGGQRVFCYAVDHEEVDKLGGKTCWIKMSNVNVKTTEKDVVQFIKRVGRARKVQTVLLRHHLSSTYPGFCYVELNNEFVAVDVVRRCNLKKVQGDRVWVTLIQYLETPREPPRERYPSSLLQRSVILQFVHHSATTESLKEWILENVERAILDKDSVKWLGPTPCKLKKEEIERVSEISFIDFEHHGYFLNAARVTMRTIKEADNVFSQLNGKRFCGLRLRTIRPNAFFVDKNVDDKDQAVFMEEEDAVDHDTLFEYTRLVPFVDKAFYRVRSLANKVHPWRQEDDIVARTKVLKRISAVLGIEMEQEDDKEVMRKRRLKLKKKLARMKRKRKAKRENFPVNGAPDSHSGITVKRTGAFKKINYGEL